MSSPFTQFRNSVRRIGLLRTLLKAALRPWELARRKAGERRLQAMGTPEERFTWIYRSNYWRDEESASGSGSSLRYTENLRRELPGLFERFGIRTVFDAPCGDFNWMRLVAESTDIRYVGADIVRPLIDSLRAKHGSSRIDFIHLDLIRGRFPAADLMICRDCLFHLSYADARRVLENFLASGIPYLLTTTHRNDGALVNRDIETGDFRMIDLFEAPFCLPKTPLARIDDWLTPDPEREMCLWSRDQVAHGLEAGRVR